MAAARGLARRLWEHVSFDHLAMAAVFATCGQYAYRVAHTSELGDAQRPDECRNGAAERAISPEVGRCKPDPSLKAPHGFKL